jgi:hypothetical protein
VKTKSKNDRRRKTDSTETVLRRLARAPETAHQIYELAESLYLRYGDEGGGAFPGRMTLADIEQIANYLREVENHDREMKKQFAELATLTSEFHPPEIPVGF